MALQAETFVSFGAQVIRPSAVTAVTWSKGQVLVHVPGGPVAVSDDPNDIHRVLSKLGIAWESKA